MFLKILREDERFRVYSNDETDIFSIRGEYKKEGMFAVQSTFEGMSLSGFCFTGQPKPSCLVCQFAYAVVSFKENALEHIEGCFKWFGGDDISTYVLPHDHIWFSHYIESMKSDKIHDSAKKYMGWRYLGGGDDCEKFDVENHVTPYYVLGNIRIKLELMGFGQSIPLDVARALGREQFAEQKRIKFTPKAPTDCEVRCDSYGK